MHLKIEQPDSHALWVKWGLGKKTASGERFVRVTCLHAEENHSYRQFNIILIVVKLCPETLYKGVWMTSKNMKLRGKIGILIM